MPACPPRLILERSRSVDRKAALLCVSQSVCAQHASASRMTTTTTGNVTWRAPWAPCCSALVCTRLSSCTSGAGGRCRPPLTSHPPHTHTPFPASLPQHLHVAAPFARRRAWRAGGEEVSVGGGRSAYELRPCMAGHEEDGEVSQLCRCVSLLVKRGERSDNGKGTKLRGQLMKCKACLENKCVILKPPPLSLSHSSPYLCLTIIQSSSTVNA